MLVDTSLFGDNVSKNRTVWGPPLQADMAQTWTSIIENGIHSQEKESLIGKYLVPENAPLLSTPKLNSLVEKVVSDSVKQRDTRLSTLQSQIGASISALGQAITTILGQEKERGATYVQPLCEAGRLLTDVFYQETSARKELACYNLDKTVRESLLASPTDEWLFGCDVDKRLEASKQIERSIKSLKPPARPREQKKVVKPRLNYRGLSRDFQGGFRARQHQYQTRSSPYPQNVTTQDRPHRGTFRKARGAPQTAKRRR